VVLTAAGAKGPSYLTEGRLTKLGSGLLHLGFIAFAIVVAALQRSELMMTGFWVATVLTMGGTLLSFYADRLAWRGVRRTAPDADAAEDEVETEPGETTEADASE
jgi:cytochrome c biogenesis protein ResB